MRHVWFRAAVVVLTFYTMGRPAAGETYYWVDEGSSSAWDESVFDLFLGLRYTNWRTHSGEDLTTHPSSLPGAEDTVVVLQLEGGSGSIDLVTNRTIYGLLIQTADYFEMEDATLTLVSGNLTRNDVGGVVEANHLISSNVTLQQAGTLHIEGTGFLRIGGVLTASNGFTKTGSAELVLSNVNNQIGGPVLIRNGTLRISPFQNGYVIDHTVDFSPLSGASPRLEITTSLTATGTIITRAALHTGAVLDVASGVVFNAAGGFAGPGRMMLTGGGTTRTDSIASEWFWIDQGTLELDGTISDGTSLFVAGGTFRAMRDIETQGSLQIFSDNSVIDTGSHRVAFAKIDSGINQELSYTLVKRGTGTLVGDIDESFARMRLEEGTFETATVGNFHLLTFDGGTLRALGSTPAGHDLWATVAAGGGAIELPTDQTLRVALSGSGDLAKRGAGTMTMTGQATSYTGGLEIETGTLRLNLSNPSGATSASVSPGATLALSNPFQLGDGVIVRVGGSLWIDTAHHFNDLELRGSGVVDGPGGAVLNLPEGALLRVEQAGSNATVQTDVFVLGNLSNPNRTPVEIRVGPADARLDMFDRVDALTLIRKTGAGTLALHGNSELFPGLQIDAGVVEVGSSAAIFYDNDFLVNDGLLRFNGGTLRLTGDAIRLPGVTLLAGGGTIDLGGRDARVNDFAIGGTGRLTVTGGGTLRLGTINNFAGGLTLHGATLELANPFALGGSGRLAWQGGTLRVAASSVGLPGADLAALSGLNFNVLELNGFDVVPGGTLAGPGRLAVTGEGSLNFFGFGQANTHAGFTVVDAATLRIDAENQLGALPLVFDPAHLVLNGATLDTSGSFNLHPNRGIQLGAGGGTIHVANGRTVVILGRITSPSGFTLGGLTVDAGDTGTLVLLGDNSFVGGTTVRSGRLAIHHGAALSTGDVVIQDGATLEATELGGMPVLGDVANYGLIRGPTGLPFQTGLMFNGDVTGRGDFEGNVAFAGSYSPGDGDGATAHVTFDTLHLAFSNMLVIEIAGAADYDQLSAAVALTLDGVIDIRFLDGFVPGAQDTFTILASPLLSGFFANALPSAVADPGGGGVDLEPAHMLVGDIAFEIDYFADGGQAVVLRNFSVVPEPSSLVLAAAGAALLLARPRRRGA